jgi:fumarate hydratase class II
VPNKFEVQGGLANIVASSATLRGAAVALMKIVNDIRWQPSGPRAGIGGAAPARQRAWSPIMPGKVNPTQCEAMVMVCIQVVGNDTAVGVAGTQRNFELNAMRPIVMNDVLHSARILGDASTKLPQYCIDGGELNTDQMAIDIERSLMLVTAPSPVIGDDKASVIAHARRPHRIHPARGCTPFRRHQRRGLRPHRRPSRDDRAHGGDDLTPSRVRLRPDRHSPPRTPNQQRHNGSHVHDRGAR